MIAYLFYRDISVITRAAESVKVKFAQKKVRNLTFLECTENLAHTNIWYILIFGTY